MKRKASFLCIMTMVVTAAVGFFPSCSSEEDISETRQFFPGETVPETYITEHGTEQFFTCQEIPDTIFTLMQGKTYKNDCTYPLDSLRYILCLHRDINGTAKVGEMVLNTAIANTVLDIFHQLYEANYPIEMMRLPDYWGADDELQMRENNSSSFNFRLIAGTTRPSKHGRGVAIDINTLYNPFYRHTADGIGIDSTTIQPATAVPYLDRTKSFIYKIEKDDLCYKLFTQHGFNWGGEWTDRKDFQHFELP